MAVCKVAGVAGSDKPSENYHSALNRAAGSVSASFHFSLLSSVSSAGSWFQCKSSDKVVQASWPASQRWTAQRQTRGEVKREWVLDKHLFCKVKANFTVWREECDSIPYTGTDITAKNKDNNLTSMWSKISHHTHTHTHTYRAPMINNINKTSICKSSLFLNFKYMEWVIMYSVCTYDYIQFIQWAGFIATVTEHDDVRNKILFATMFTISTLYVNNMSMLSLQFVVLPPSGQKLNKV